LVIYIKIIVPSLIAHLFFLEKEWFVKGNNKMKKKDPKKRRINKMVPPIAVSSLVE
jgi:hypothetical protein